MRAPKMDMIFSHEPDSFARDAGHDDKAAADQNLCVMIFEMLQADYPGHYWTVKAESRQGYAFIRIPMFMDDTLGYILHLDKITSPEAAKRAVRLAGGEILERWNIPRSKIDFGAFLAARQNHLDVVTAIGRRAANSSILGA